MDAQKLIDNIELVIAKGKSIQKAKKGVEASQLAEREARDKAKELKREMLAVTTAMVNDDDLSQYRDSEVIHKELLKANNRIDKMIDKTNRQKEELEDIAEELMALLQADGAVIASTDGYEEEMDHLAVDGQEDDEQDEANVA